MENCGFNLVTLLLSFSQQSRLVILRPLQLQRHATKLRLQRRHMNPLEENKHGQDETHAADYRLTTDRPSPCASWALSPSAVSPVSTPCAAAASLVLAVVPRPAGAAPVTMATTIQHDNNRKWGHHNLARTKNQTSTDSSALLFLFPRDRNEALLKQPDWLLVSAETGTQLGIIVAELQVSVAQIQDFLTIPGVLQRTVQWLSIQRLADWVTQHFQQTSLCSRSFSALLLSVSLSSSSSFLLTDRKHFYKQSIHVANNSYCWYTLLLFKSRSKMRVWRHWNRPSVSPLPGSILLHVLDFLLHNCQSLLKRYILWSDLLQSSPANIEPKQIRACRQAKHTFAYCLLLLHKVPFKDFKNSNLRLLQTDFLRRRLNVINIYKRFSMK